MPSRFMRKIVCRLRLNEVSRQRRRRSEPSPSASCSYAAKDTWIDELEMLHRRCPMGVFPHDEAFYYYGLTDREPIVHTLTIYSGYNVHRLKEDGYKVYTVKKELPDVGKRTVKSNQGNEIPMYDLERTICDLVRSRSSIGFKHHGGPAG